MNNQMPGPGFIGRDVAEAMVSAVPHWHHKFEIFPGVVTPGAYDPLFMLEKLRLPHDMSGMRVLDVGPSDGFFSMQMALRGATTTAIDYRDKNAHGFGVMEHLTGLKFDYHQMNIYDIEHSRLGKFDVVLFLGVLYHLPDMMRALDTLTRLCRSRLIIETHIEPDFMPGVAAARYYEAATLAGDHTNFWVPNKECLHAMLRDTGLQIDSVDSWGKRMLVGTSIGAPGNDEKLRIAYGLFR